MSNEIEIDLNQFVPNVQFELIPIKNLVSNQDYQRNLSVKHVQKAAAHFDLRQINPVKVSRRNGINYVFNGQHTIEIIALVSGSRETPVWCMVYDDLIYEEEADIFANQLKYTKALSPYEIFMANVEAENDIQLTIKALVESYDLVLSAKSAPGNICAISTVEDIYEKYGFHVLDRTIRLIVQTWEGEQKSFSANMLSGVARLVNCFQDTMKDTLFIEKLGMISIRELSRTAKDRHAGSLGYSEAMLIFYNKKNTGGLQIEKLYSKSKMPAPLDVDTAPPVQHPTDNSTPNEQISLFYDADNDANES